MKVAIYCRVSDDKKKSDGERRQDVHRQVEFLIPIVLGRHPELNKEDIKLYIDDGKSAFTEDWNQRQDFKQLFNDCRRHFVEEIWVEDMTRFSRRIDVGLPLLRELGELNIQMISAKEGEIEVTSAKGWLQSSMLLMFAEWDSRSRAEKIRSGMEKAKNLGKKVGGFRKKQGGTSYTPPHSLKIGGN